jgi:hypothetical protein
MKVLNKKICLDQADLQKLYNKNHEWHQQLVDKFSLPSVSELPSLPQPFMLGLHDVTLEYAEATGKYGKGYAEATYPTFPSPFSETGIYFYLCEWN